MDQGFDEEVEIKNLLAGFFRIDRSLQARWPDDVQPNKITRCILLKKDDLTGEIQRMRIQLKTERGEKELERSLPLSDCIQIIKSCINVKLVDVIINYIRMFGLSGIRGISSEKPCAMHSQSTVSLWRYLISKDLSVSFRGTVPAISSSTTRFGSQSFYFIGKSEELPVNKNYKHGVYSVI